MWALCVLNGGGMKEYSDAQIAKIEKALDVEIQAFSVNPKEGDEQEDNISF